MEGSHRASSDSGGRVKAKPFFYFASQRALGSRVREYFHEFLHLERARPQDFRQFQERRLESILEHAAVAVPFYRERVPERRPALRDFPILTKADVRTSFSDLMTEELRLEYTGAKRKAAYSWIAVKTGGSTGVPTTVIHDREYRDRGRAGRLYSRSLCGFPLGTPYFRLWGSMQEINQARTSWKDRAQAYLSDEIWLNAFRMEERDILRHISTINSTAPEHMMAYVDAAVELARFAQDRHMNMKPLRGIMSCAGTLTPSARTTLQNAFQAQIHNQYGSRDCGGIACECDHGRLHVYGNNLLLEVVDDRGDPAPADRSGRLLVTLLGNRSFPLIRYEIGDVGVMDNRDCECGRPFPLLARVEGRTIEFLRSTKGGYVSPLYVIHLVGVVHNPGLLRRFQLVQRSAVEFILKLELERGASQECYLETVKLLERDLKAVLGTDAQLRISKVAEIPPTASGKFLYTINEYQVGNENSVHSHSA